MVRIGPPWSKRAGGIDKRASIRRWCLLSVALVALVAAPPARPDQGAAAFERGDYAAALAAWNAAAGTGDGAANYGLALLYRDGKGVEKDPGRAFDHLLRAAQSGFLKAQVSLAALYETGQGTRKSPEAAAQWQEAAARQGHVPSLLRLAERFADGDGVARNRVQAYALLVVVSARGRPPQVEAARGLMQRLEDRLGEDDLAAARRQAATIEAAIADASAATESAPAGGTVRKASAEPPQRGGGTGFVVDKAGHVLTTHRVASGCRSILAGSPGKAKAAEIIAVESEIGLALLKLPGPAAAVAPFATAPARLAESIVIYGFPLPGVLASSGNVGVGIVSALTGVGDDPTMFQITAPIRLGLAGAPILNQHGRVIGIVVRDLSEVRGGLPPDVGFGIRLRQIRGFLERHDIDYQVSGRTLAVSNPQIAKEAIAYTLRIQCIE